MKNGNILGPVNATSAISVSGIWRNEEVLEAVKSNSWPSRLPPVASGLIAVYDGDSWNGTSWQDVYGNYHATTTRGTITSSVTTGNGASRTFKALSGNTNAGLQFPSGILPSTYTLFHVTRTTGTRSRIVTGSNNNWLSAHWGGRSGVAYHEGWVTSSESYLHGDNWVYSTDQNYLYRSNGVERGTSGGGASTNLTVNYGAYGEYSDWAIAFLAVYNRTLNSTEYLAVESWLASKFGI